MFEKLIQGYVKQGLTDFSIDGRLSAYLFAILPDTDRESALQWVRENIGKTQVVMGYRRELPTSPLISIVPAGETETDPPIGGLGEEYTDEYNRIVRREGTWMEHSYRCLAISINADACSYLAAIMKQSLLRYRVALTDAGLLEQRLSLTDLSPAENYSDPNVEVFQRGLQISGSAFSDFPVFMADPVTGIATLTTVEDQVMTVTASAPVLDTFTRAANSATLVRTDSHHLWTPLSGTWGVVANTGYLSANGADSRSLTTVDSTANATVSMTVNTPLGARLALRFTTKDNGFYVEAEAASFTLKKVTAGSLSTIGTYSLTPKSGDEVKAVLAGATISVFVNGSIAFSVSQAFNQTAIKHGIAGINSTAARWTKFVIA